MAPRVSGFLPHQAESRRRSTRLDVRALDEFRPRLAPRARNLCPINSSLSSTSASPPQTLDLSRRHQLLPSRRHFRLYHIKNAIFGDESPPFPAAVAVLYLANVLSRPPRIPGYVKPLLYPPLAVFRRERCPPPASSPASSKFSCHVYFAAF